MKHNTPTSSSRRGFRGRRLAIGVSTVAAGLGLMLTPLGASGQVNADAAAVSAVTVAQTPAAVQGECIAPESAIPSGKLTVYPFSDMAVFQLKLNLESPLCTPLNAKAVVYSMPSDGAQWPQNLVESVDVTFQQAGETIITFAKACDRVQYDLVAGEPPSVLNTGFEHNLLFTGNLETAFQHVGNGPGCEQVTTTVAPTTTAATTTTLGNVVLGTSTIPTTTIPAAVRAATTVPSSDNAGLAVTGTTTSGPIALMGGGLVFIGLSFMLASRRRAA